MRYLYKNHKIEVRFCKCGCTKSFECTINSKRRYINGHNRKGKHNSSSHNRKISKGVGIASRRFYRNHRAWNYGKTKDTDNRIKKYGISRSITVQGKTHKELFGKTKAKLWKRKISKTMKNKYRTGKIISYFKGKKPWNYGLTKETDKRIAKVGLNNSKKLKGRRLSTKHLKRVLKARFIRPNKFETLALEHINTIYSNRFIYCGDGSVVINGRSPDAIDYKTNTVALFHGVYWHLRKRGLDINEENKKRVSAEDACPFIFAGYKVIVIWEDELDKIVTYGKRMERNNLNEK